MSTTAVMRVKPVLQHPFDARFVNELVHPDQPDQQEHERRHLRHIPCAAENVGDNVGGVAQRAGPKENPGEANESEGGQLFGDPRDAFPIEGRSFQLPRESEFRWRAALPK